MKSASKNILKNIKHAVLDKIAPRKKKAKENKTSKVNLRFVETVLGRPLLASVCITQLCLHSLTFLVSFVDFSLRVWIISRFYILMYISFCCYV